MEPIKKQLLDLIAERNISDRQLSVSATGSTDTVRNLRRGANPRADTLESICRVLGAELVISSGGQNLNKNKFNSDNPAIATALQLPEGACLDEILSAIEVLVARSSDARWSELKIEISALRRDIKKLTPGDD